MLAVADLIERELDGGDYLVGDGFSVADLTGGGAVHAAADAARAPVSARGASRPR